MERRDEVGQLLEVLFSDDEKFISMDYNGGRLSERWSLVAVHDGSPKELTPRAPGELIECIRGAALEISSKHGSGRKSVYRFSTSYSETARHTFPERKINFSKNDLVLGGEEHEQAFRNVLSRSKHRVVIHSTFISRGRFHALFPAIKDAVLRGVRVDVLWGQDEALGDGTTRDAVHSIRSMLDRDQLDSLHVHPFSTGSHSKILLADNGDPNHIYAFVGSCNWLSSSFQSFEATVRLRDPSIVADVVNQVAELSRGGRGHWSPLTKELAAMSSRLRANSRTVSKMQINAQLILGASHANMVRRARDKSTKRIFVASHRWGTAATSIVLAPALTAAKERGVRIKVYYGKVSGPTGPDEMREKRSGEAKALTIGAVLNPRLHAKVLAWDEDSIVVTSQNWLSSDPPDSAPRQEIGVFLNGSGLANSIVERFESALQVAGDVHKFPAKDDGSQ